MSEKQPQPNPLEGWRQEIDRIDTAILDLLAQRFRITEQVGEFKAEHGMPAYDASREYDQRLRLDQLSMRRGLNTAVVQDIFGFIRDSVKIRHRQIQQKKNQP